MVFDGVLLILIAAGSFLIAYSKVKREQVEEERERLIRDLTNAIEEIKTLKGILPICSYCKKIRDDMGAWKMLEIYISEHSEAKFSHGLCPECHENVMKELEEE